MKIKSVGGVPAFIKFIIWRCTKLFVMRTIENHTIWFLQWPSAIPCILLESEIPMRWWLRRWSCRRRGFWSKSQHLIDTTNMTWLILLITVVFIAWHPILHQGTRWRVWSLEWHLRSLTRSSFKLIHPTQASLCISHDKDVLPSWYWTEATKPRLVGFFWRRFLKILRHRSNTTIRKTF